MAGRATGSLIRDQIVSKALAGNPLGDPTERDLYVYLPPGYADSKRQRYPVVLIIAGFTGIAEHAWQRGYIGEALHERMDRLIRQGKCPPMILAAPDCVTALGGSQFVNSAGTGDYETFVTDEVVAHVDAGYRTKASARHRAICGKSSGGYGALWLGMRHPKVFGALASHSGDAYFEYCYATGFVPAWWAIQSAGGLEKWLRGWKKRRLRKPRSDDVHTINTIAMAACYSPDANEPAGIALPFQLDTGELRPEVMRRWRRYDPAVACKRYAKNLRKLRGIFIDCGFRDEWALQVGARVLSKRLNQLGIDHIHEEFDDNHRSISYRYDRSLPQLAKWIA